jgi:hypothetical protein
MLLWRYIMVRLQGCHDWSSHRRSDSRCSCQSPGLCVPAHTHKADRRRRDSHSTSSAINMFWIALFYREDWARIEPNSAECVILEPSLGRVAVLILDATGHDMMCGVLTKFSDRAYTAVSKNTRAKRLTEISTGVIYIFLQ